jgi:hypothetical protein
MKHECSKCGFWRELKDMRRVKQRRGLPVWECVTCEDWRIDRWTREQALCKSHVWVMPSWKTRT